MCAALAVGGLLDAAASMALFTIRSAVELERVGGLTAPELPAFACHMVAPRTAGAQQVRCAHHARAARLQHHGVHGRMQRVALQRAAAALARLILDLRHVQPPARACACAARLSSTPAVPLPSPCAHTRVGPGARLTSSGSLALGMSMPLHTHLISSGTLTTAGVCAMACACPERAAPVSRSPRLCRTVADHRTIASVHCCSGGRTPCAGCWPGVGELEQSGFLWICDAPFARVATM